MGKDCGRGNKRLGAKAGATSPKGGGRVENLPGLPRLRISFEMSRISAKRSLNMKILYIAIQHYISQLSMNKRGYVIHALRNSAS